LVSGGLLDNPDSQFLFSSLALPAGAGTAALTPSGESGDVTVQAGAVLSAPTTADHVGGMIALIGPNVNNAGTISTPDGQTILAAGQQVGFAAHPSNDPSLRGLDVYVGAVDGNSGTATNDGLIYAPRADVTITGKTVNQLGMIDSSTSVSLNGRIDLLADYNSVVVDDPSVGNIFSATATGAVTLGAGSVTQILPELSSADTVTGTQLALSSLINIQGKSIYLGSNSILLAPSAALPADSSEPALGMNGLVLSAGVTLNAGNWVQTSANTPYVFASTSGQVYLDSGALIDVAGSTNVMASVTQNIVAVQLEGTELADSPLERGLSGLTVQVDIGQTGVYDGTAWIGTPLADVSGYANLIQYSVGELTTSGGSVQLNAGNSVVMQTGATINVSGRWTNYQGGGVKTSALLSGGHIYNISDATPNLIYNLPGFTAAQVKWGATESYTNPLQPDAYYEQGYIQGGNGGSIAITAPSMVLSGNLIGNTVAGAKQQASAGQIATTFAGTTFLPVAQSTQGVPNSSTLSLVFQGQDPTGGSDELYSPTPPNIAFQSGGSLKPANPFALDGSGSPLPLRSDELAEVVLSPGLLSTNGFGNLVVSNGDGNITVPVNVSLTAPAGGSISLSGANIDIEGKVTAPGGSLSFNVYDISPFVAPTLQETPQPNPTRGNFTLGPSALLSTAGLIVDNGPNSSASFSLPLVTNGGRITIDTYNANLAAGSLIDVSGGVAIGSNGKATYGNGGSIQIAAGQDPEISSVLGGKLVLNASLKGYAGGTGGILSILAPQIQVGGGAANANTLLLLPNFFNEGGFSSFTLTGIGAAAADDQYLPGLVIASGVAIAPVAQDWQVSTVPAEGDGVILTPVVLPQGLRTPVSLSFNAEDVKDLANNIVVRGDLVVGAGSFIQTDPKGSVSFAGDTVEMLGSVLAPGGSITVKGAGSFSGSTFLTTVDIGPSSVLSTAGATLLSPNAYGYRTGTVLNGGKISISGNIVAEAGSVLNVSGASDVLDMLPAYSGIFTTPGGNPTGALLVPTREESNGGSIILNGAGELFTDATLIGAAGGPMAQGGSLSVSSGRADSNSPTSTPLDATLLVTQSGPTIPASFYSVGNSAIGNAVIPALNASGNPNDVVNANGNPLYVLDANGNPYFALGHFAIDSFSAGGFDSLTLSGVVQFYGPVTVTARNRLTVGSGGIVFANAAVNLNAPYVALGEAFQPPLPPAEQTAPFMEGSTPFYFSPLYGAGSLTIDASLIDIGNLSLQNIGKANFTARGAIRGDGTLDVAGAINMTAAQIYPPTASTFTVAAYDSSAGLGTVNIQSQNGSLSQTPLSAGGELNIYASTITQDGTLRAPVGTINLGWKSTDSEQVNPITNEPFDATRTLTLGQGSLTSVSAIDSTTGKGLVIPYGTNENGTEWIDPTGTDITAGGVPSKQINLSANSLFDNLGSAVDISGGGDLYAYNFVPGTGGTKDILASTTSFAVIPGYQADFAPDDYTMASGGSNPYENALLNSGGVEVGERIYLAASNGLPAGVYTLLPARYALLPGAFLVTPESGVPVAAAQQLDGSSFVAGYRFNGLDSSQSAHSLYSLFEVDSQSVVRSRADYENFSANSFLSKSALAKGERAPRLPIDAGQLVMEATQAMSIQGSVASQTPSGGLGSLIDISSPSDIIIAGPNTNLTDLTGSPLVLNSSELSAFGAASLLVGGVRQTDDNGTEVAVTTGNVTVDNAGADLSGPDIILVANEHLTLASGAAIQSKGTLSSMAETIQLSGAGAALRVSGDSSAQILRSGVNPSSTVAINIGANVQLAGANITLDSTGATLLDPSATLKGDAIALNSGQISLELNHPGSLQPTAGLVLSGQALQALQNSAKSLSLLSYSSIDIYGTGQVGGSLDASGQYPVESLALSAAEIRGFNNGGGTVSFNAANILLDNSSGGSAPGSLAIPSGVLEFNAGTIRLGVNQLNVDQYSNMALNAANGVLMQSTGGLAVQGDLTITSPLITGATAANQTIQAAGALTLQAPAGKGSALVSGGLGAQLTLLGASVTADSAIDLSSGDLTLHATGGDVTVGNGGKLDAGGTAEPFFDLVKYTSGGQISLISDTGDVNVTAGGSVSVTAASGGGDAGSLSVSAINGAFTFTGGNLNGQGAAGGQGGTFLLEVGTLPSLAALEAALNPVLDPVSNPMIVGGFTQSQSIRVRHGNVAVDGVAAAETFNLSADSGDITVTGEIVSTASKNGTIDLTTPGTTGGTIDLVANGSLTLAAGSLLTVAGQGFNDAGKGGAVTLEADSETNGNFSNQALGQGPQLNILSGATIDLSVASVDKITDPAAKAAAIAAANANGDFTGTLHLRAPQAVGNTDLQLGTIDGSIVNASSIVVEGYQVYTPVAGVIDSVEGAVLQNGNTFVGSAGNTAPGYTAMVNRLFGNNVALESVASIEPGAEIINPKGDLILQGNWDLSQFRFGPNSVPGDLTLRAAGNLVFNYNMQTKQGASLSDGFGGTSAYGLWDALLLAPGTQSWSYRLVAGADFTAADFHEVLPLASLAADTGSLLLGAGAPALPITTTASRSLPLLCYS
jgi:hypothetical protein